MAIDKHSQTWFTIENEIKNLIEEYRGFLEAAAGDKIPHFQGRIAACRKILSMADKTGNGD